MACRDDRSGIAPEIPLLKGQHPFHLKIDQRNYLPKYTEIKSHQIPSVRNSGGGGGGGGKGAS